MGLKNPQAQFEDGIFGPGGMHPTPASLPYPSQPLKTIYGETVEYLIPAGQKEKVLKKLYPFGDPPPLNTVLVDIHAHREFTVRDFKVVEQNGYVMPVSPYFAEDGASVVDWEPKGDAEAGVHVAKMTDEAVEAAYARKASATDAPSAKTVRRRLSLFSPTVPTAARVVVRRADWITSVHLQAGVRLPR